MRQETRRREPSRLLSPACSGNEFLDVSRGVFRPPLNAHLPSHLHFNFGAIQIVKKLRIGIRQYIGNVVSGPGKFCEKGRHTRIRSPRTLRVKLPAEDIPNLRSVLAHEWLYCHPNQTRPAPTATMP